MANTHSTLTGLFSDIADSIRAKTGGTEAIVADQFPAAIEAIPTGTESAPPGEVNCYDYDGSIVKSYTAAEFLALSALPDNPSHDGLTAQGWNWSLSDAQSYVADYGRLNIGQMYRTDDGKTRLYLRIDDITRPLTTIYFQATVDGGVTIDWGDGSPAETSSGTAARTYTHSYGAAGDYVISLAVTSGALVLTGTSGSSGYGIMGIHGTTNLYNCTRLRRVELGDGVTGVGDCAFYYCYSLTSITLPLGVTSIRSYAFYYCYSLTSITIPPGVTSIGGSAFVGCNILTNITTPAGVRSIGANVVESCFNLISITIPPGVTSIGNYEFRNCYSLTNITIPPGVTSIGGSAFQNCYGVKEYHLCPATPPTLSNTTAFTGIPADCIIYVPQGSLEAYQAATNWSTYASKMQEEPT